MKSIPQLSREYKIAKQTLRDRAISKKLLGVKIGKEILYDFDQQNEILDVPSRGNVPVHLRASKVMIQIFMLMHPTLDAEEVSRALSINLDRVKTAFKDEYLILESKINKK